MLNLQTLFQAVLAWVDGLGAWGPIAFIVIYNVATVLFIPGSLLTLGGGIVFGVVWGSLYVFVAATTGATVAFLIGRYLSRDWVARRLAGNGKFKAIAQAVTREGFKIVLLTRLSPIFPFNLLNYAFGITQVSLKDYVLGFVGMVPGTIMYVYIGSLLGDLAMLGAKSVTLSPAAQRLQLGLNVIGFLATAGVTLYVTQLSRTALQRAVALDESSSDGDTQP